MPTAIVLNLEITIQPELPLMNTTTTETPTKCIEWCNRLLRGERSAVETYLLAIEKHRNDPRLHELKAICEEHRSSVSDLEKNVRGMGGEPDTDSGAWGQFAQAVQIAANLFGSHGAVESLQQGEEHGLKDYRKALDSGELMPECVTLMRDRLIPRIESHLTVLDRVEERVD